jgi:hypothetical protein
MSNAQAPLRTSLLLIGAGLVTLGQAVLQDLPVDQRGRVVWFSIVGIILFLVSVFTVMANKEEPSRIEQIIQRIASWLHISDWQLVLLLSSPLLSWIAWRAAGEGRIMINPAVAITAWISAITVAIIGSFSGSWQGIRFAPRSLILPLTLTIAAFLVRGLAMNRFPIVLTGDEGSAGLEAVRFLKGEINNPFVSAWYSFPSLYFFIQSLSVRLLEETPQALRLPSAIAGALTVAAVFYAGSAMFDRRSGLLAAIFLAAYSYHIHFSRIGLNNIWDGFWYIIVIGALWYGWEHEQYGAFTLAGFSLGAAQYFYPSGRALVIPILVWLFLVGAFNREKFKRVFSGILIMFIVSAVIVLPLALFYFHHSNEYMAPFVRVSIFGPILDGMVQSTGQPVWLILLKQIWKGLQAFTYIPITAWYQPGTPLLRSFAASLFLIGILLLFIRSRSNRFLLLALWILTFGLIGGFSESTPASQRYIAAAPVCALLIGYGLSETTSIFEKLWPQLNRILNGVAIALAILVAANELNFYFNTYTQKTMVDLSHSNTMISQHLANYLQDKQPDLQVVFMGSPFMGYYSIPNLQFLAPDIKGIDATLPWDAFDKSVITGKDLIFVFLPGNESALDAVKMEYPGGQTHAETASDGKPLYWYYEYFSE